LANFYVTHNKFPQNPQLFTIDIQRVVKLVGEPNTSFAYSRRGETYWEIHITTTGTDINGDAIESSWIDVFDSEETIDEVIGSKLAEICGQIDWSNDGDFLLEEDRYVPYISYQYPAADQTDVPLHSSITIKVKELLPGEGIDIDTISLKVKGVSVVPSITGNPFEYTITYTPKVTMS
jgi:hypothetical protein